MIFEHPGYLVATDKKTPFCDLERDFFLEEVERFNTAMFEAVLFRSPDRVEHSKVARSHFPSIANPGVFITGVPERDVVSRPLQEFFFTRYGHMSSEASALCSEFIEEVRVDAANFGPSVPCYS